MPNKRSKKIKKRIIAKSQKTEEEKCWKKQLDNIKTKLNK